MAIPVAAIIAAAAGSAGSSIIGDVGNFHANQNLQEDAQAFNAEQALLQRNFEAEQAQIARDFTKSMDNTKFQRMISDMQKAGINPAVIGATGAGSTPSASVAHGNSASSSQNHVSFGNIGQLINSAFNAALVEHMKDEHFTDSLMNQTAYEAQRLSAFQDRTHEWAFNKKKEKKIPQWLKEYEENFEDGVVDL